MFSATSRYSLSRFLGLISPVSGRQEFQSNILEGVFWVPDKETDAFAALQNNSADLRHVTPVLFIGGKQFRLEEMALAPHETAFLKLKDEFERSGLYDLESVPAGGIRLISDGAPGEVTAEGGLLNPAKGFAKRIRFMDSSLHFYDTTLRASFLFLGEPLSELGFPPQISFRAVAVMRNASTSPITVTPLVKYPKMNSTETVRLPEVVLSPNQVKTLDLLDAQLAGLIPSDFRQGTLELESDGLAGALVAELTNLDSKGGYVVSPPFTAHPSRRVSGFNWRIDGDWQTLITLTNAAASKDKVDVELFYDEGSYRLPPITVPAHGIVSINLKDLQRDGTPDAQGNILAESYGSYSVTGSHGGRSAITAERLIYSRQTSDYLGLPGTPCDYVLSIDMYPNCPTNDCNPVPVVVTAYWNSGAGSDETLNSGYSTDNPNLCDVSQPGSILVNTSLPPGSQGNVTANLVAAGCVACSVGSFSSAIGIAIHGFTYKLQFVLSNGNGHYQRCNNPTGICPVIDASPSEFNNSLPVYAIFTFVTVTFGGDTSCFKTSRVRADSCVPDPGP